MFLDFINEIKTGHEMEQTGSELCQAGTAKLKASYHKQGSS